MPTLNQSWVAGESIGPSLIVRQDTASPRQILKATLGYLPVGVTHEGTIYAPIPEVSTQYAVLSGDACRIYGPDEECEVYVSATLAIAVGDPIAPDAASKAQPGIHGFPILGYALDSAAAAGKVRVRVAPAARLDRSNTVLAKTANYTMALADLGKVITNTAATGAITIALPAAVVGYEVIARVDAAYGLQLDPNGTEQICLPSTGVPGTGGKYIVADAVNEGVHLKCHETGIWDVISYTGTWTAEA